MDLLHITFLLILIPFRKSRSTNSMAKLSLMNEFGMLSNLYHPGGYFFLESCPNPKMHRARSTEVYEIRTESNEVMVLESGSVIECPAPSTNFTMPSGTVHRFAATPEICQSNAQSLKCHNYGKPDSTTCHSSHNSSKSECQVYRDYMNNQSYKSSLRSIEYCTSDDTLPHAFFYTTPNNPTHTYLVPGAPVIMDESNTMDIVSEQHTDTSVMDCTYHLHGTVPLYFRDNITSKKINSYKHEFGFNSSFNQKYLQELLKPVYVHCTERDHQPQETYTRILRSIYILVFFYTPKMAFHCPESSEEKMKCWLPEWFGVDLVKAREIWRNETKVLFQCYATSCFPEVQSNFIKTEVLCDRFPERYLKGNSPGRNGARDPNPKGAPETNGDQKTMAELMKKNAQMQSHYKMFFYCSTVLNVVCLFVLFYLTYKAYYMKVSPSESVQTSSSDQANSDPASTKGSFRLVPSQKQPHLVSLTPIDQTKLLNGRSSLKAFPSSVGGTSSSTSA